jgi:hypothetical protein
MELLIQADGHARCLYGEELDLAALGRLEIRRGSFVEPTTDGQWTADLAPVGGPELGPFASRSAALDAEREWLSTHWLCPAVGGDVSTTSPRPA